MRCPFVYHCEGAENDSERNIQSKARCIQQGKYVIFTGKAAGHAGLLISIEEKAVTIRFGDVLFGGNQADTGRGGELGFHHTADHTVDPKGFRNGIDLGCPEKMCIRDRHLTRAEARRQK